MQNKKSKSLLIFVFFVISSLTTTLKAESRRLNLDWLFIQKDIIGAKEFHFDDSYWRHLNLPHDWAFENGYSENGAQGDQGGYTSGGIGWYRKSFNLTNKELNGHYFFLDFDAVYMNSQVWINGHYLGKRPYGYISFSYEITPYLLRGKNVISVRVDNSLEPSARWYHGCGIYGNVYLRKQSSTFFQKDGISIITSNISKSYTNIEIESEIISKVAKTKLICQYEIVSYPDLKLLCLSEEQINTIKGENNYKKKLSLTAPVLWSPENPHLYLLRLTLLDTLKQIVDKQDIRFGIRSVEWNPMSGLLLNKKQVKMCGVCEHLEGGPVGAMYTEKLLRWKLQLLKDMGCNAIRTAHNPQIPMFYDLCDEMGFLVIDEIFDGWLRKADYDYGMQAFDEWWKRDLKAWIRRDRKHPSIVIYSIGNETKGKIAKELIRVCHETDPSRKVTSGHSVIEEMDVCGYNGGSETKTFLETYIPNNKTFLGTENPHTWQVRGFYRTKTWYRDHYNPQKGHMYIPDLTKKEIFTYDWISPKKRRNMKQVYNSSYDNATVRVTARHILEYLRDKPWFSGSFRWTGFDYLGEAGYVHGGWPFRAFQGGVLDLAGFKKDSYYLYQSEWTEKDMVHILPHWTHPVMKEGTLIPVWVYTTGEEVELFQNGKSLGKKKKGKAWNKIQCEWLVPWKKGKIEAIAYRNNKMIAKTTQETSNAPSNLNVTTDNNHLKADGEDVAIITIREEDQKGVLYPYGENRIYIQLLGDAHVLSFENGCPTDVETNFQAHSKCCFFGLNRLFIQSNGEKDKGPVSLIVGAICGDKKLQTSDLISIDVKELALRGNIKNRNFRIFYTVNGEDPIRVIYKEPFAISLGTTVKAAVFDRGKLLLQLEERFDESEGLYWLKSGENQINLKGLQAEDAIIQKGNICSNGREGYYGNGYVYLKPGKGTITWYQENDGGEMECSIALRYAISTGGQNVRIGLFNNDKLIKKIDLSNFEIDKQGWRKIILPIRIYSGANSISIKSISEDTSLYIDQIEIIQ